jgi:hypothetical protein
MCWEFLWRTEEVDEFGEISESEARATLIRSGRGFLPSAARIRKDLESYFGRGKMERATLEGQIRSDSQRAKVLAANKIFMR